MRTIDIDFEVYKALTARLASESMTYNDAVRELLGLLPTTSAARPSARPNDHDWICKGVRFPVGTDFRARHKGNLHTGRVENGGLVVNGRRYENPSLAATAITNNSVNGWTFWECRLPGEANWRLIKGLRAKT